MSNYARIRCIMDRSGEKIKIKKSNYKSGPLQHIEGKYEEVLREINIIEK